MNYCHCVVGTSAWLLGLLSAVVISALPGCRSNPTSGSPAASASHAMASGAPPIARMSRPLPGVPALDVPELPTGVRVVIDGKLDEVAWQRAASTGDFVNVGTGAANENPALGGRALLMWDRKALYVAVVIHDTDIHGDFPTNSVDPHLWTESTAEIMVDPDGDGDNIDYYEIQIGPQNLVFDSQFDGYNQPRVTPNGPFGHQEWTAHARTAVSLRGTLNQPADRDEGYTVEAEIPWASFAKAKVAPPRSGDQWRMNFYAMRNNGGLAWSPVLSQGNFHKASRFGRIKWIAADAGVP